MSARAWFLFALVSVVWGTPYFFIKITVDAGVHPTVIVFARTLFSALVLLPLVMRGGTLLPVLRRWRAVLALAACEIVAPFLLITYGEQRVSSSLAGLLIATLPLVVALLAMWIDVSERASGLRLVGMLIGLSGVALVLGFDLGGGSGQMLGAALILLATLCYAAGTFVLKLRLSDVSMTGVMGAATAIAAIALAPAAAMNLPATAPGPGVWLSLVALGLLCTAVGLVAYGALIAETGPGKATVITYINPAIAVVLGVAVLGEPLTATVAAGFLLIIAGSWLSTGGTLPPRLLALPATLTRSGPAAHSRSPAAHSGRHTARWGRRAAHPRIQVNPTRPAMLRAW